MTLSQFYKSEINSFELDGTYPQARMVMGTVLKHTNKQNIIEGIVGLNDLYDSDIVWDSDYVKEAKILLKEQQSW